MDKPKDATKRKTHSIRLNPDLIRKLKYIALDEERTVGDLVEEGIEMVIAKREKGKK